METSAVLLEKPEHLTLAKVGLKDPSQYEVVVRVTHSGISTGTEKLLWSGAMPRFQVWDIHWCPGMKQLEKYWRPQKELL